MSNLITTTINYVKQELAGAEAGHDWLHIERVWNMAKRIAKEEKVNMRVVELGALLHDIADHKFHNRDEQIGPRKTREFLQTLEGIKEEEIDHVVSIVKHVSWKGRRKKQFSSPEFDVVQDADRLDAMGAMGIARVFTYGGYCNRPFYDDKDLELLRGKKTHNLDNDVLPTSIYHFYEKLLLLKEYMNTETGKKLAQERHEFMEAYLQEFYCEVNGER
jgi:uncharacterized protein